MPLINAKLTEESLTPDQKREIVGRLTEAMVSIERENCAGARWQHRGRPGMNGVDDLAVIDS